VKSSGGVSSNKIITNVRKGHLATDESSCLGVIRCSAAARQKKKKILIIIRLEEKKKKRTLDIFLLISPTQNMLQIQIK
jgi:hypothetical protein